MILLHVELKRDAKQQNERKDDKRGIVSVVLSQTKHTNTKLDRYSKTNSILNANNHTHVDIEIVYTSFVLSNRFRN